MHWVDEGEAITYNVVGSGWVSYDIYDIRLEDLTVCVINNKTGSVDNTDIGSLPGLAKVKLLVQVESWVAIYHGCGYLTNGWMDPVLKRCFPAYKDGRDSLYIDSQRAEVLEGIKVRSSHQGVPHLVACMQFIAGVRDGERIQMFIDKLSAMTIDRRALLSGLALVMLTRWNAKHDLKTKNISVGEINGAIKTCLTMLLDQIVDQPSDVSILGGIWDKSLYSIESTLRVLIADVANGWIEDFISGRIFSSSVLLWLSRMLSGTGVYFSSPIVLNNKSIGIGTLPPVQIGKVTKRAHLKILNKIYPYTSDVDRRHMTTNIASLIWTYISSPGLLRVLASHHTIYRASRGSPARRKSYANSILKHIPVGTPQPLAIALFMAAAFHTERDVVVSELLLSKALQCSSFEQHKNLKDMSTYYRRCATGLTGAPLNSKQVGALAYYELCFGRSVNITNWDTEIKNRCSGTCHIQHPDLSRMEKLFLPTCGIAKAGYDKGDWWVPDDCNTQVSLHPRDPLFYDLLRAETLKVARVLVSRKYNDETFGDFFQRRSEWMASGSSSGATVPIDSSKMSKRDLKRANIKNGLIKVGKRGWAESITLPDALKVLNGKPFELAHASEKFENGKARAIYGVEPWHYLINTYATMGFEERLHLVDGLEKGSKGLTEMAQMVNRANITSDNSIECTMLDYADFNRHHTPEAQAILFESFAEVGRDVGLPDDWIKANLWVAQSKYNMSAVFPGGVKKHIDQGMFSGTRSTDLINTILNISYFHIAKNYLEEEFSLVPKDLYNVHQGDDVWISNKSHLWARSLYYTLNCMGFIFQERKQMFGFGRGEYLRVMYQDGSGVGYFARAMANYILRPLQNDVASDPRAWAKTIADSCDTLVRRGLELYGSWLLWQTDVNYWVVARAHPSDKGTVSIPLEVVLAPACLGGWESTPPGMSMPWSTLRKLSDMPSIGKVAAQKLSSLPSNMTNDWITKVSEMVKRMTGDNGIRPRAVKEALALANYQDVARNLGNIKAMIDWKAKVCVWRDSMRKNIVILNNWVHADDGVSEDGCINPPKIVQAYDSVYQAGLAMNVPVFAGAGRQYRNVVGTAMLGKAKAPSLISDGWKRMVAGSTFKSDSMTAQALNVSITDAWLLILQEASRKGGAPDQPTSTIVSLISSSNRHMVELIMGGSMASLKACAHVAHPGLLSTIMRDLVEASSIAYCRRHSYDDIDRHMCQWSPYLISNMVACQDAGMNPCQVLY